MKAPITIAVIALHLAIVATILVPGCKSSTENAELNPEVTKSNADANVVMQPVKEDDSVAIIDAKNQEGSDDLRESPMRPVTLEDEMLEGSEKSKVEKIEPKNSKKTNSIQEESSSTYIVKKGDTLSSIASRNGVNLSILMEANGMNRKSIIKVGQKLTIPTKSAQIENKQPAQVAEETSAEVVSYVVQKGDNLSKIASKYHTSVAAIMELNGMTKTSINIGRKLKIPTNSKATTKTPAPVKQDLSKYEGKITHTVKSGDTLGGISKKYSVPMKTLMEQNGIQDARKIRIGKVLIIKDKAENSEKATFEDKKPTPEETKAEQTVPVVQTTPEAPEVAPAPVEAPAEIPADAVNTAAPQVELPSL